MRARALRQVIISTKCSILKLLFVTNDTIFVCRIEVFQDM